MGRHRARSGIFFAFRPSAMARSEGYPTTEGAVVSLLIVLWDTL